MQTDSSLNVFVLIHGKHSKFLRHCRVLPQIESDEHAFGIGKITDNVSHRQWQLAHEGRHSKDLIIACELRILHEIDHFNVVFSLKLFFADQLQII